MALWPNGSTLPPNLKPGGGSDPDAANSPPNADGLIVSSEFMDADHGGYHAGLDEIGFDGQPRVAEDATVVRADWFSGYGRTVDAVFHDGYMQRLAHLSGFAVGLGQQIPAGTIVGPWGGSGYGQDGYYGTHTHDEFRDPAGNPISPRDFRAARSGGITQDEELPMSKDTAQLLNSPYYVESWYRIYLGRGSDPAGKVYWIERVGEKGLAGAEAMFAASCSSEIGVEGVVANLYRSMLGREPDPTGLASWAGQIRGGALSVVAVKNELAKGER